MQLGMPTLIETSTIKDCASLCKELQLNFVELNMNLPQYQLENIDAAKFADVAKRNGIYYTIHLDENLNVCDFNKRVADAYLETVLRTIELAQKLEIPILNMHMSKGVYFTMPNKKIYLFDKYTDVYFESLQIFRDACEKAIGSSAITICIENTSGYNMEFLQKGLSFLLASRSFGLTFDIGHNAGIGGTDEDVIVRHANKLCHMHVHDAVGKGSHLPLGTGELDLPKYFAMANQYDCRVVLETKTIQGLAQSVQWIKNKNGNSQSVFYNTTKEK